MQNVNRKGDFDFPESEFWLNYSALKEKVNALKRKSSSLLEVYDPLEICGEIEKILDIDEEENLSFLHKKIRKLSAGSELCKEICILQRQFSILAIDTAVSEVLEEVKHEEIASRIISRRTLEARREKFFLKQALDIIRNSVGEEPGEDEEVGVANPILEEISASPKNMQSNLHGTNLPGFGKDADVTPTSLDLSRVETARASENLEMSKMSGVIRRMSGIPESSEDIPVPEIQPRQSIENDINLELKGLEDILGEERGESPQKDISGEPDVPEPEIDEITPELESLPVVLTPPKKRRRIRPAFDPFTVLPNYCERARRLTESTVVERVQVYEGPPSIIQAFTIRHLLEMPAVNNGFCKTVRSSALERLYKRNQKTQRMLHADIDYSIRRSAVKETIIEEDSRHASRSEAGKANVFDVSTIQSNVVESKESALRPDVTIEEQLERLVGTPVSKILQRDVVPPVAIGSSDPWLPPRSPRMKNLQGRRIEPPIAEPWFKPTEQPPPDEKWREFNYVRARLEEVWRENVLEKGASLRQVLHREGEWNKENMLTLLRIVDKLSLRKEVILKGTGENVIIHPFEIPYVTEKQYSLRFNSPKY